jgi:hypothetical protein
MCAFQLTEVGVGLLLCMSDSGIWFTIGSSLCTVQYAGIQKPSSFTEQCHDLDIL